MNFWGAVGVLSLWGLEYFAYVGILDNAANRNPNDKSLVGGSSLDLLGLTVVIQFGTVLWSPKLFWLLLVVPVWGGWTMYSTMFGGSKGGAGQSNSSGSSDATEEDKALAERRQKRAEKRRQKRA